MAIETLPNQKTLKEAFEHEIYSSDGTPLLFGSLFDHCSDNDQRNQRRVLVIFIRHFFCGNCQEYIRRLSSPESPFHPSHRPISTAPATANFSKPVSRSLPRVIIIGPGLPTLISSYTALTQCLYPVYADPSTRLYDILGMHRTLSLGQKAPGYIQHSLMSGAMKSAWQIVRRVGSGDAMGGGDWNVNGGEFLFVQPDSYHGGGGSKSNSPWMTSKGQASSLGRGASTPSAPGSSTVSRWEISWCHRMLNSRDHTELVDLQYHTCLTSATSRGISRANSPPKSILVNKHHSHSSPVPTEMRSYSSECLGSCPGPDVPKTRDEVWRHHQQNQLQSSQSKSTSHRRSRSQRTSSGSHVDITHHRTRFNPSCSESRASNSLFHTFHDSVSEEGETQPRKSLTSNLADRVGVLVRSKSLSDRSTSISAIPMASRVSTSRSEIRPGATVEANSQQNNTRRSITGILRSGSKSKSQRKDRPRSLPSHSRHNSAAKSNLRSTSPPKVHSHSRTDSKRKSHSRTRTFSFSKPSVRKSTIEMDENGIMLVDGVEFVNVISVKARVDSGLGLGHSADYGHGDARPVLPAET
ncbi:uncharacterized protein Z518_11213 [Rhinocladiella mackenziei CBS 650.93]|uniref:Uncharacterized protein n=1 Tax=Rhinocladiella mackenziei CBS 650.93 TaxID=1442369 RepID=A0A0D2IRX6_9EURO|nr:uncharacterized protein Z518_11213 [Rhinocladiella mackenziei CBS 650.93]KIW99474.1 hypothetical protein Z518_11213 [Rhinocladiella mackenziei CBS 650.93]